MILTTRGQDARGAEHVDDFGGRKEVEDGDIQDTVSRSVLTFSFQRNLS